MLPRQGAAKPRKQAETALEGRSQGGLPKFWWRVLTPFQSATSTGTSGPRASTTWWWPTSPLWNTPIRAVGNANSSNSIRLRLPWR